MSLRGSVSEDVLSEGSLERCEIRSEVYGDFDSEPEEEPVQQEGPDSDHEPSLFENNMQTTPSSQSGLCVAAGLQLF